MHKVIYMYIKADFTKSNTEKIWRNGKITDKVG